MHPNNKIMSIPLNMLCDLRKTKESQRPIELQQDKKENKMKSEFQKRTKVCVQ